MSFFFVGTKFCWISNGKALLVIVGVPVAAILLFNFIALSLTLASIRKVQKVYLVIFFTILFVTERIGACLLVDCFLYSYNYGQVLLFVSDIQICLYLTRVAGVTGRGMGAKKIELLGIDGREQS